MSWKNVLKQEHVDWEDILKIRLFGREFGGKFTRDNRKLIDEKYKELREKSSESDDLKYRNDMYPQDDTRNHMGVFAQYMWDREMLTTFSDWRNDSGDYTEEIWDDEKAANINMQLMRQGGGSMGSIDWNAVRNSRITG
jgi:hypothetical protein